MPKAIKRRSWFTRFAKGTAHWTGRPSAFIVAFGIILAWGLSGPIFGFSDTWQLVINTSTTIVTFLMVFLIQNTQNRDSEAMHLKLDELIRSVDAPGGARRPRARRETRRVRGARSPGARGPAH